MNLQSFLKRMALRPIAPDRETEAASPWYAPLTPREAELAELVANGLTDREIAVSLGITERHTVGYFKNILNKLSLRTRTEFAGWVATHRTPDPGDDARG